VGLYRPVEKIGVGTVHLEDDSLCGEHIYLFHSKSFNIMCVNRNPSPA
ncbi:MAG: hypothetical protein PWP08_1672, partial [Methanofollis sp.]|nr:hypothetical protein [Methanofollis sp.]